MIEELKKDKDILKKEISGGERKYISANVDIDVII